MSQEDTLDNISYDTASITSTLRYEKISRGKLFLDPKHSENRTYSSEKPATATMLEQVRVNLDQQSNESISESRPSTFRNGRRFKLILTN